MELRKHETEEHVAKETRDRGNTGLRGTLCRGNIRLRKHETEGSLGRGKIGFREQKARGTYGWGNIGRIKGYKNRRILIRQ